MATATYTTTLFGDEYSVTGDFAQASSPVLFNGATTQYQVADFSHAPTAAMRRLLEASIEAGGDDPDDDEFAGVIDEAIGEIK
jgi:hypothetical protein